MVVIDGIIEWIRRYARSGSRFRAQIEEEGFDEFKAFVLKKADSSSFVAIENKRLISDTE
jgi:anaerobic sulfite reductase subunit C